MTDLHLLIILGVIGFGIGFVGGLVGLILGVIRFPFILGTEFSAGITAGTNIGVSTLGAFTAAIRHYKQNNIHFQIFVIMAATGAVGAFLGSLVTKLVPIDWLLSIIGIIVSYEAYALILGSRKMKTKNEKRHSILIDALLVLELVS